MKRSLLIASLTLLISLATVPTVQAETADPDTLTTLDVITHGADAYTAQHLGDVAIGAPVHEHGVLLSPQESRHPSIDALKAMGYLPQTAGSGDVRLEMRPANCNMDATAGSCPIVVHVTVAGITRQHIHPLRPN